MAAHGIASSMTWMALIMSLPPICGSSRPKNMRRSARRCPAVSKRIEINLTTQTLSAYEYDKVVFQTNIASGIPGGPSGPNQISTTTPNGEFYIQEKMPAKHMGSSFYGSIAGKLAG